MITINKIIKDFVQLACLIKEDIDSVEFETMMQKAEMSNAWFEKQQIKTAIMNFLVWFDEQTIKSTIQKSLDKELNESISQNKESVAIICAGNIPTVAFHDIVCVLVSGNKAVIKLSSNDEVIIPFLLNKLIEIDAELNEFIELIDKDTLLKDFHYDAIIATGSNSSAMYFEHYFANIPHLIRHSRTSLAVIQPKDDISGLEDDIMLYFGLGCRSVSSLFVPKNYDFSLLKEKLQKYSHYVNHNKYRNNLDYHKAIFIMNNIPFEDMDVLLLKCDNDIYSAVSVLNYSYYDSLEDVKHIIQANADKIQCVIASNIENVKTIHFGYAQQPMFDDFADGFNTLKWLNKL